MPNTCSRGNASTAKCVPYVVKLVTTIRCSYATPAIRLTVNDLGVNTGFIKMSLQGYHMDCLKPAIKVKPTGRFVHKISY